VSYQSLGAVVAVILIVLAVVVAGILFYPAPSHAPMPTPAGTAVAFQV
jgi:hypothetical protein